MLARDVIRYVAGSERDYRVVWSDAQKVVLLDLADSNTIFSTVPRTELEADLDEGRAQIQLDHNYDRTVLLSMISEAQRKRRDRMLSVIRPIVAMAPDIFDTRLRGRVVARVSREGGPTSKTVHAALDRWWKRGMTDDALLPDFDRCGVGERSPRAARAGRKQPAGAPPGIVITPEIEEIFRKGLKRFYRSNRKNSLKAAFELMRAEYFVETIEDPETFRPVHLPKQQYRESGYPTERQFRYWYNKNEDVLGIRRQRKGAARSDKDDRAITGSAVQDLLGVGSRFEIDSTPIDVSVVSTINRRTAVGRPTFYQVTDVLSKLVCGIYVGFEEASWSAASLALGNVIEDKVAFARRYGVEIDASEWPCVGVLPARLLADRGEFKGHAASEFTARSLVNVENAAPYRGDLKGTVEKKFDQFHIELRKKLTGYVTKNHAERGEADYRRDSVLTLPELIAAVIHTVILLNKRKLTDYPRSREMIADDVRAVPNEMWRWAVSTGRTELRSATAQNLRFATLPTAKASITERGIAFRGLHYVGDDPRAAAYARARQDGRSKVEISYDPTWTTTILLHDRSVHDGFVELRLSTRDDAMRDISFEEAAKLAEEDRVDTAQRQFAQSIEDKRHAEALGKIDLKARKARKGRLKASELSGMKDARKAERERERQERNGGDGAQRPSDRSAEIIDIGEAAAAREARIAFRSKDPIDDWLN